jgi:subtilisin family serine protease
MYPSGDRGENILAGKSFGALGALAAIAAVVTALLALPAAGGGQEGSKNGLYIVQLASAPVVAYEGGVAGIAATAPADGDKIDPLSPKVVKYSDHLKAEHQKALDKVGGGQKLYDYTYSYNGFAARLSSQQAAALKLLSDVVAVSKNEIVSADTSSTPTFLGLDAPGGLWEQLGGTGDKKDSGAGEGIIIGDIDSGIWPENPSFSDRDADGKLTYQQIPGWHGTCTPGENFTASNCNQKLIGAQYFNAAQGGNAGIDVDHPWEFNSARDYNGHGSHTAGTAGGNFGVQPTGPAASFGKVSGIAPRARIAVYKALWSTEDGSTASGATADLVAAIDQAVADGVDVINYSISGSQTNFADPVMIAYLFAARAGIFVSTSAGNSGPTTSTVAHPSPWVTTVAAGTHNRNGVGSVTLGNAVTLSGASVATAVSSRPLIDSTAAGLAGADASKVELCYSKSDNGGVAVLDPAKVAGKIVICKRGITGRTSKSLAVLEAGGVGMILYNDPDSSLNADFHFVPTVHVSKADGLAAKAYATTPGATASINAASIVLNAPAPLTASFSSRGPLTAGGGDLLKPDVIAPGQDILAAVAPPGNAGREFNLYSGTSMSAPHVTGLAALLMQKYPSWSPMAIKSALMTSAGDVLDGPNTNPLVIFRQGAGHVAPNRAANPGLVYDAGWNEWLAFLCGNSSAVGAATCNALTGAGYSTDASDMNVASIAIGDLAGIQTVKRTVRNVGGAAATYTASLTGLAGIDTVVTPSSLTIPAGGSASFTVKFTRTTATLGAYVGGQLTWSDGTHAVRVPVVLKPVALAAPAEVTGTGGPLSWSVTTGYAGSLVFGAQGLVPATTTAWTVAQDPDQTFDPAVTAGTYSTTFTVPAGLTAFRAGIYENAITPTGTDLDLFVYQGSTLVAQSADGDSNEEVTLRAPAAGTYTVYIHGYLTNGPSASGTLFSWQLGSVNAGNMTVPAAAAAVVGGSVPVSVGFTGLAPATRYFGAVAYSDGTNSVGSTLVTVNTP